MRDLVRLEPSSLVFERGATIYAVCECGDDFVAAEVVFQDGAYYRRESPADLPEGVVEAIVCQKEYKQAKYLDGFPLN